MASMNDKNQRFQILRDQRERKRSTSSRNTSRAWAYRLQRLSSLTIARSGSLLTVLPSSIHWSSMGTMETVESPMGEIRRQRLFRQGFHGFRHRVCAVEVEQSETPPVFRRTKRANKFLALIIRGEIAKPESLRLEREARV